MAQATVSGTKIRGRVYYLNISIPPPIRHLYGGRERLTDTLKTADPKVAANGVIVARAEFIRQVEEVSRAADINARLAELPADQRELYDRAGGLEGLLTAFQRTQTARAFMLAGDPTDGPETDLPDPDPHEMEIQTAEHRAASAALEGIARREAKALRALGQKVEVPGGDLSGIAELAEAFIRAKGYTVQLADSMRYTARRWIEFHTDLPLAKLTRAYLAEFDEAARDLPVATSFRKKPMRAAVAAAKKGNLPRVSYKVRERLITHLKAFLAFATDKGLVLANPWVGYKIDRPKMKVSERKGAKVKGFLPSQVGQILDYCAETFDNEVIDHWLPLLGSYTGARREELGQLTVENVRLVGNIHVLDITDDDPEQKVKNMHSMRVVPIPSPIIEAGFLDLVDRRRKAGGRFLFLEDVEDKQKRVHRGEVKPDRRGRITELYGQHFSRRVLVPLEIKVKGQAFHALRHSWTDAARRAKIDPEIRRLIAGRLDDEDATEAGYGGDDLLAEKLDALETVAKYVRA